MQRKEIGITILVGLFTALVWTPVFIRLGTFDRFNLGSMIWGLVIIVPLIYIFGLYLGAWLSKRWAFFTSFAKYVMVGFLNAGVDFAVFNLLMFTTGNEEPGLWLSIFKAIGFIVAVTNSYFWNKNWAFKASNAVTDKSREFAKFFTVNIIGALLNVGIASGITILIAPQFGFTQAAWNNIAAVIASAIVLIWNFVGFRLIVFKNREVGQV